MTASTKLYLIGDRCGRAGGTDLSNDSDDKHSNTNDSTADSAPETRQITLTANRLDARDLFSSTREISIGHGDETYRLRLTSQNKLILTK